MTTHRSACRRQLYTALSEHQDLASVEVEYGWPGEIRDRESVFLGRTSGQVEVPVFRGQPSAANPLTYDDVFTIDLFVWAATSGQSAEEADERGDAIRSVVQQVLRVCDFTDDPDNAWSFTDAVLRDGDSDIGPTGEGFAYAAELHIDFNIRISGEA